MKFPWQHNIQIIRSRAIDRCKIESTYKEIINGWEVTITVYEAIKPQPSDTIPAYPTGAGITEVLAK